MNHSFCFDRLVASVERIARHSYYPGIDQAISLCLEDIDEYWRTSQITTEQREALRFVLAGMSMAPEPAVTAA